MSKSQANKLNFYNLKFFLFIVVLEIIILFILINNQYLIPFIILLLLQFVIISALSLHKINKMKEEIHTYKMNLQKKSKESDMSIQELHTANEELRALNKELIKSKKELEELSDYRGRFLVNMSHELRTPLNSIIGFSTVMLDNSYDIDRNEYREMVQIIHDSSKKLLTLINNILDLTKVETSTYEPNPGYMDINNILEASASICKGMLKNNSSVIFNFKKEENLPKVWADERALSKALNNIIDNAVKFTKRGEITLKAYHEDKFVIIEISDTGIGINSEIYKHIFEPFITAYADKDNRTLSEKNGTGIGLALSKYLLEIIEAELLIDSQDGHGTVVKIKLKKQDSNA